MTLKGLPRSEFAEWAKFITTVVVIPISFAAFVWVFNHEKRLVTIEASRWTASNQAEYAAAMQLALALKADSEKIPAPEVRVALKNLTDNQAEMRGDIAEIRKMVFEIYKKNGGD